MTQPAPSRIRLLDLRPRMSTEPRDYDVRYLIFLCPKCRRHEIGVYVSSVRSGEFVVHRPDCGHPEILRVWAATFVDDLTRISVTPSINRAGLAPADPCGGWHGFIAEGEVL